MRKLGSLVLLVFLAVSTFSPSLALADDAALLARLDALENEVKLLKRQLEVKKEDEDKKKTETPIVTASAKDGFSIKSPDDNFKLKITGYAQAEGKFYTDNKKDLGTTDTFQARSVRLTAQGTVNKDYDFYISPEFAGTAVNLPDAYIDVHYWPEFKIRAGKFKEPFGFERLQSTTVLTFAELGLPSNLAPNRDVGVQVFGDLWDGKLTYAVGAFNGVEDLGTSITDSNQDKDIAARVFAWPLKDTDLAPLKGLGVGIATTYGHKEGSTGSLPTYRSPGQTAIFSYGSTVTADGPNSRLSPQIYYSWNSFGLLYEYITSSEEALRTTGGQIVREKFENDAWQIAGSYVLTGEDATYKGVNPRHPFSLTDHTWGAFEIAARFGELDIDNTIFELGFATPSSSVSRARAWGLGLNWYLNKNFRWLLDYERTNFDGGGFLNGTADDRPSENTIWSRFQIVF